MYKRKFDSIDYGYDRLERVVVQIPEIDLKEAIAQVAREKVFADGKTSVEGWGRHVRIKEWHDGVGVNGGKYAEVTFTRRVKEDKDE